MHKANVAKHQLNVRKLYHSEVNNGQAGVGFLVNKKWKDNITRVSSGNSRVADLVLRVTDRCQLKIVQLYAPATSHSDEDTHNFYNTIDPGKANTTQL